MTLLYVVLRAQRGLINGDLTRRAIDAENPILSVLTRSSNHTRALYFF